MNITTIKKLDLSRSIPKARPFVEGLAFGGDLLFFVVNHRRGRTFFCCDGDMKARYELGEEALANWRPGDYRCFGVDPSGNLLIAGSESGGRTRIITIDTEGKAASSLMMEGLSLLEGIAAGKDGLYLHSPLFDTPVRRFADGKSREGIGVFPPGRDGVSLRSARIHVDREGFLWIVFESAPPCIQKISPDGKEKFSIILKDFPPSLDLLTPVLDSTVDLQTGGLYLLMDKGPGKKRLLRTISSCGKIGGEAELNPATMRICAAPGGILYLSGTRFSTLGMLLSFSIYGSTRTMVEKAKLEPDTLSGQ